LLVSSTRASLSAITWTFFLPGIERPAVINKMNLTLSADHRVFDGQVSGL
jgi:hypothetical protein